MVDFRRIHAEMIAERENISVDRALARLADQTEREASIRAANQGHLAKPGIPYFVATGVRQLDDAGTNRRDVRIVFEVHPSDSSHINDPVLKVVEGAVTGFESWYLDERFLDRSHLTGRPTYLCAGGMGWEQLFLEPTEAERLLAWAREHSAAPLAAV